MRVRAVGTEFDVYKKRIGTVVTVVEGRVAVYSDGNSVQPLSARAQDEAHTLLEGTPTARELPHGRSSSILLSAGEQLTVARNGAAAPRPVDAEAVTAWVQKRLIFEETALSEVADEFNRYNTRALIIEDPALQQVRISGVYSSTDPTSLLGFLRAQPGIQVIETPQSILIRKR